jgi:hypothetical protein
MQGCSGGRYALTGRRGNAVQPMFCLGCARPVPSAPAPFAASRVLAQISGAFPKLSPASRTIAAHRAWSGEQRSVL